MLFDFRVTIVANDGTVLADTNNVASAMENHANRPEIATALAGEVGIDTRESATENRQELYVAVPMSLDGEAAAIFLLEATWCDSRTARRAGSSGLRHRAGQTSR
ncbi:MAG: hypothetical protein AB2L09_08885 [Coriobacteriia bacterium]